MPDRNISVQRRLGDLVAWTMSNPPSTTSGSVFRLADKATEAAAGRSRISRDATAIIDGVIGTIVRAEANAE